jgi:hypothetical protein
MNSRSRILFLIMSTAFILSALGLILGMLYDLYLVFLRHTPLEIVMGRSIPYYKTIGGFGILGMVCFFLVLLSEITSKGNRKPRE